MSTKEFNAKFEVYITEMLYEYLLSHPEEDAKFWAWLNDENGGVDKFLNWLKYRGV